MEIEKLLTRIGQDGLDFERLGRDFFDGAFSFADTRLFFNTLLRAENMHGICPAVCAAYFSNSLLPLNYRNFTGLSSLDARYFEIFIALCSYAKLELADIFPYLIFVLNSPDSSRSAAWKDAAASYLFMEAGKNFNKLLELFLRYDTTYSQFHILMKADYGETVASLCEMFLNAKVADKAAMMKFFFDTRPDIASFLMRRYAGAELKHKRAIVRLLLLYKNDGGVTEFLQSLAENEPSKLVRGMIEKDVSDITLRRNRKAAKLPPFNLTDAMVSGERLGLTDFSDRVLKVRRNARIAETIFFSVFEDGELTAVAVIDKGVLCNLDNEPLALSENAQIGVLHPCDTPQSYEYIKRLNIDQKLVQLRRKTFKPDYAERSGYSMRLSGRTVSLDALLKKARKYKFFFINKEHATDFRFPAAFLGGYALVIEMFNTDCVDSSMPVGAGRASFYRAGDLIRIRSKCYTKNVPLCPADEIPPRTYSELMLRADLLLSR